MGRRCYTYKGILRVNKLNYTYKAIQEKLVALHADAIVTLDTPSKIYDHPLNRKPHVDRYILLVYELDLWTCGSGWGRVSWTRTVWGWPPQRRSLGPQSLHWIAEQQLSRNTVVGLESFKGEVRGENNYVITWRDINNCGKPGPKYSRVLGMHIHINTSCRSHTHGLATCLRV